MRDQTQEQLVKDVIRTTLYVLSILVNVFLLYVIWRDPVKRFRNAPSYTIANLALADMVAAIGGLGACVDIFMDTSSPFVAQRTWMCISTAGQQSSFLIIATLAFDRYLAISHPYRYRKIFCQNHCSAILNISAWVVAWIVSATLHFFVLKHAFSLVSYHLYVTNLSILALVTSILYPLNYWNFLKALRRHESPQRVRVKAMEDLRLAQQLNLTWMIVASFHCIAMVPYVYVLVISINKCYACLLNAIFVKFWTYYQVAFPAILCVNPLVYAWRLPLYRKALKTLLTHLLKSPRQSATLSPASSDTITLSNRDRSIRTATFTQSLATA